MRSITGVFFIFTFLLVAHPSWARGNLPYGHSFFSGGLYSGHLQAFALGPTCTALKVEGTAWPCQPAYLANQKNRRLTVGVLLGDEFGTVDENRRLLVDDDNIELVRNLFDEPEPVRMEAALSLAAQWDEWSLIFTPYRYSYASVVQNRYYPEISLYAVQETSLTLQYGHQVDEHWHLGAQLRGLRSKWLIEDVFLFDTFVDDDSLAVREQTALFFEPGAVYSFNDPWNTRLTAFLSGFGYVEEPRRETPKSLTMDLGLAISPPVMWAIWDLALVLDISDQRNEFKDLWYLGTTTTFKQLQLMSSLAHKSWSYGFMYQFGNIGLGALYKRFKVNSSPLYDDWEDSLLGDFHFHF